MASPYADWMADLYERIKDQQLGDIVIPASHDSGSFSDNYVVDKSSIDSAPEPYATLIKAARSAMLLLPNAIIAAIIGNARTQDRNLGQQLEDGIRVFDLRVLTTLGVDWYGLEKNTFYLTHTMTSARDLKLEPQLDMIAKFAADHPKEIIILQVGHPMQPKEGFGQLAGEDMSAERRADLVNLLKSKFGPRIFRYDQHYSPTPSESAYPRVSEIKVRGPVEAGQNITVLSDLETAAKGLSRSLFWPESDQRSSWEYTRFISNALMTLGARLRDSWIMVISGDVPDDPFTENQLSKDPGPTVFSEGIRQVVTKLLLRRHEEAQRNNPPETPPYTGVKSIDLSRKLFNIGFTFSTFDNRDAVNTVNPYALDLLKEWEKGIGGKGPGGREANTRKQINVVSFDYYNHFDVVKTVVEMNENRFPWWWRNLGRLECGFRSELAVGQNEDGRLEVFAVGTDGEVWTNCQTRDGGKWAGWNKLKPWSEGAEASKGFEGAKDSNRIVVVLGMDRRMQLFACGKDGAIWNVSQTAPNEGWGKWQSRGRPADDFIVSDIAVGQTKDGRLDVHVTNRSNRFLRHTWQTHINDVWYGNGWDDSSAPSLGNTRLLALGQDAQGRQEIVVVCDSDLYHALEDSPNTNSFRANGFNYLGNPGSDRPLVDIIDVGRNQDGRLEAFALCSGQGAEQNKRYVCNTWQLGPNKDWTRSWQVLGAPPKSSLRGVAVSNYADGRLVVFGLDDDSRLWRVSQSGPNGGFGVWEPLTASPAAKFGPHLQVGRAKDGAAWLFTYGSDNVLWGLRA